MRRQPIGWSTQSEFEELSSHSHSDSPPPTGIIVKKENGINLISPEPSPAPRNKPVFHDNNVEKTDTTSNELCIDVNTVNIIVDENPYGIPDSPLTVVSKIIFLLKQAIGYYYLEADLQITMKIKDFRLFLYSKSTRQPAWCLASITSLRICNPCKKLLVYDFELSAKLRAPSLP